VIQVEFVALESRLSKAAEASPLSLKFENLGLLFIPNPSNKFCPKQRELY
jgi:hypothetical protein